MRTDTCDVPSGPKSIELKQEIMQVNLRSIVRQEPRWQGDVARPIVRSLARTRSVDFERLLRIEWRIRTILGQPLSRKSWPRMTFNDKVDFRRMFSRDATLVAFSDKLAMREYAMKRLGHQSVPKLIHTSDCIDDFVNLPGPYVLKANHGSGMVIFVGTVDRMTNRQSAMAEAWLSIDYCWDDLEWGYRDARRCLIAEEKLVSSDGEVPDDYKFFVFDGSVQMIQVDSKRFENHRRLLLLPDWTPLEATLSYPRPSKVPEVAPANLETMSEWASVLGKGLDFVRVDLYDLGSQVLVGELTPYPGGGRNVFRPSSYDHWLGGKWVNRDGKAGE